MVQGFAIYLTLCKASFTIKRRFCQLDPLCKPLRHFLPIYLTFDMVITRRNYNRLPLYCHSTLLIYFLPVGFIIYRTIVLRYSFRTFNAQRKKSSENASRASRAQCVGGVTPSKIYVFFRSKISRRYNSSVKREENRISILPTISNGRVEKVDMLTDSASVSR